MKTINYLVLFLFGVVLLSCKNNSQETETKINNQSKVEMLAGNQLRYLELSGTPYERGLAHGTLLKKEINEVVQLLKDDIKQSTGKDPEVYIKSFVERTDYLKSISKWTPELIDELKGISEGSGIDFNTIFMHQLPDEYWIDQMAIQIHKCSSFGIDKTEHNPCMTAQNMDIPSYYHGYQTVIKLTEPSGKQIMLLTIPGFLGLTGMNNKGVSVNVNTILQLDNNTTGLPVTFIVRGITAKDNQEQAIEFLKEVEHASGQNYIIGGPEKVYDFECSANQKVEYRPFANSKFTYHTNYPLANKDYSKLMEEGFKKFGGKIEDTFKCERFPSFEKRFNEETTEISIDEIKEVLSSRDNDGPDVVSNQNTYASIIYKLSETPEFIIAPGKPHEVDYITIKFQ